MTPGLAERLRNLMETVSKNGTRILMEDWKRGESTGGSGSER